MFIYMSIYHSVFCVCPIVTVSLLPQVCTSENCALDTVYGVGDPNVYLYFSFDWAAAGTHQFGHYTLLLPVSGKAGKDSLALDEVVS